MTGWIRWTSAGSPGMCSAGPNRRQSPSSKGSGIARRNASCAEPFRSGWPVVALLLLLGVPFLGVRWGFPDDRVLPSTASAHQVGDQLRQDFANNSDTAVTVVVPNTDGISPNDIERYAADLSRVPDVSAVSAPTGTFVDRQPRRTAVRAHRPGFRQRIPHRRQHALRCSPTPRRTSSTACTPCRARRAAGRHGGHRPGQPRQCRRDHVAAAAGARAHRRHHVRAAVPVDRQHRACR